MVAAIRLGLTRARWVELGPARPIVVVLVVLVAALATLLAISLLRTDSTTPEVREVHDMEVATDETTFTQLTADSPFSMPLRPVVVRPRPVADVRADAAGGGVDARGGRGASSKGGGSPSGGGDTGSGGPATPVPPTSSKPDPRPPVRPGGDAPTVVTPSPVTPAEPVVVGPVGGTGVEVGEDGAEVTVGVTEPLVGVSSGDEGLQVDAPILGLSLGL